VLHLKVSTRDKVIEDDSEMDPEMEHEHELEVDGEELKREDT
jgi:hypothetical protein